MGQVTGHGPFAKEQGRGDLPIGPSLGNEGSVIVEAAGRSQELMLFIPPPPQKVPPAPPPASPAQPQPPEANPDAAPRQQ